MNTTDVAGYNLAIRLPYPTPQYNRFTVMARFVLIDDVYLEIVLWHLTSAAAVCFASLYIHVLP